MLHTLSCRLAEKCGVGREGCGWLWRCANYLPTRTYLAELLGLPQIQVHVLYLWLFDPVTAVRLRTLRDFGRHASHRVSISAFCLLSQRPWQTQGAREQWSLIIGYFPYNPVVDCMLMLTPKSTGLPRVRVLRHYCNPQLKGHTPQNM